jgi:hypothetical protein
MDGESIASSFTCTYASILGSGVELAESDDAVDDTTCTDTMLARQNNRACGEIDREGGQGGLILELALYRAECGNEQAVGDQAAGPAGGIAVVDRPASPQIEVVSLVPVFQ